MLSQKTVGRIVAGHVAIVWLAMAMRVDHLPFTWAPMFANAHSFEGPEVAVELRDRNHLKDNGWRVTRQDGAQSWLKARDLDIGTSRMAALYYGRTFGLPKQTFELGPIDRIFLGDGPRGDGEGAGWKRRLFASLNKTLGHEPADPGFIVALEATGRMQLFDTKSLELLRLDSRDIRITWDPTWSGDFE
ncbi:MAG: hypothetical protein ACI8W3_000432 [Myxococcota bacterium]|jgi:hypothetical protein